MANTFATHFCSVYSGQVSNLPFPHQTFNGTLDTITLTLQQVLNKLRALDPNSNSGPDSIHPNLLKACLPFTLPIFLIFQKSFSIGQLPKDWKKLIIIAIFKKGSRYIPLNYRPISLASVICKTRMIHFRISTSFSIPKVYFYLTSLGSVKAEQMMTN